jgi:hypothetical protein
VALALVAAPFVLDAPSAAATWNGLISGILLAALTIRRGKIRETHGSWDRYVR